MDIIKEYGTQISSIIAMLAFVFAVYKYIDEKKRSLFWKEFEVFHKLIKDLVEPTSDKDTMYLDRQIAIIFELKIIKDIIL